MAEALSIAERDLIDTCLRESPAMSWAEIGRRLDRHPSTISREVARNHGRAGYRPRMAQQAADDQMKRPKPWKLVVDVALRELVIRELDAGFSPAAISHRIRTEEMVIATDTIYRAVYAGLLGPNRFECLRTRRPQRKHRLSYIDVNGSYLGAYTPIGVRPAEIETRTTIGHWEGDLIIGQRNQSAMITLIERASRLTHLIALPHGYGTKAVVPALAGWLGTLPASHRRTLTWDQGSELTRWRHLEHLLEAIYFCDARSPWQRGSNEQNNRTLRYWMPRGTRLDNIDPAPILAIINHQPRRSLNWRTPHQAYQNHLNVH